MRSVLVGAVESTRRAFRTMAAHGSPPELLVTLPFEKSSRHSDWVDLRPEAKEADVEILETTNINDAATLDRKAACAPDMTFVIGWSQMPPLLVMLISVHSVHSGQA